MPATSESEKPSWGSLFRRPPSPAGGPPAPYSLDGQGDSNPPVIGNTSQAGPSSNLPLDNLFNFQIVVFQVEGTLFQVLKNGFNVPGTIFEAMFTLPVATPGSNNLAVEGSTVENPIHLSGVSAKDFRAFLRILYPFIGPSLPFTYDDWVGILDLSTTWNFNEFRAKAISSLSTLIVEKSAAERISLGRKYRVASWLREEYIRLAQQRDLKLEELRDSSAISLDWETIAKLLSIREKNLLRQLQNGVTSSSYECYTCSTHYGWDPRMGFIDCRCNLPSVIDSVFGDELQAMTDPADLLPVNLNPSKKKRGKRT